MDIRNHLRVVRQSAGVTAKDLAEAAGVSVAYIGKLERGESYPTIPIARRIAAALGSDDRDIWPDMTEAA